MPAQDHDEEDAGHDILGRGCDFRRADGFEGNGADHLLKPDKGHGADDDAKDRAFAAKNQGDPDEEGHLGREQVGIHQRGDHRVKRPGKADGDGGDHEDLKPQPGDVLADGLRGHLIIPDRIDRATIGRGEKAAEGIGRGQHQGEGGQRIDDVFRQAKDIGVGPFDIGKADGAVADPAFVDQQ